MKKLTLPIAMAALALAQTPDSPKNPEFEVASIRPAKQDGDRDMSTDGGAFRTHNLTLKRLIASAYSVDMSQVLGGPNWVDSDSYDINAKIPREFAQQARDQTPVMIQRLLADRFQLVVHREPRQVSGYALVVARKGPKMERATSEAAESNLSSRNARLTAKNVTMEAFAKHLTRNRDIGKLVVDKTGLTGKFNFELVWKPEQPDAKTDSPPDDRPSIFVALQNIGLTLQAAKVPVQAIVIDRAEKPAEN